MEVFRFFHGYQFCTGYSLEILQFFCLFLEMFLAQILELQHLSDKSYAELKETFISPEKITYYCKEKRFTV